VFIKQSATETLFVVDAMTGQDAVMQKAFNDILNFDG
jgi:signal recognition particle GTPase